MGIGNVKVWFMGRFVIVYRNIRNQSQDELLLDYPLCSIIVCYCTVSLSPKSAHEPLIFLECNS